jgi:hypothetical protein
VLVVAARTDELKRARHRERGERHEDGEERGARGHTTSVARALRRRHLQCPPVRVCQRTLQFGP